jgi:DNA modification methylase
MFLRLKIDETLIVAKYNPRNCMIYSKMILQKAMNVAYNRLTTKKHCIKHSGAPNKLAVLEIISGCFMLNETN